MIKNIKNRNTWQESQPITQRVSLWIGTWRRSSQKRTHERGHDQEYTMMTQTITHEMKSCDQKWLKGEKLKRSWTKLT
jgi:hypothetical protein